MPGILILDDDPDVALAARLALRKLGAVAVRHSPAELPAALDEIAPDVLLLDMNFTAGASDGAAGLALLREVVTRRDAPAVVVMTAYAEVELAVQICGKIKGRVTVAADAPEPEVLAAAREAVAAALEGKTVKKEVYVPGRLVNIVAV